MIVVGVDPAPRSGAVIAYLIRPDGLVFEAVSPDALADRLTGVLAAPGVGPRLICWEAPLTGPTVAPQLDAREGAYSRRPIEVAFSRSGLNPPSGISVLPYCLCPHWTISRAVLGHPRVSRYDVTAGLPHALVFDLPNPQAGSVVTEVHSAVAIWVALGMPDENLSYKGRNPALSPAELFERFKGSACVRSWRRALGQPVDSVLGGVDAWIGRHRGLGDDRLDAVVALLLGIVWLSDPELVGVFGDAFTGSFLLPRTKKLCARVRGWNREACPTAGRWSIPTPSLRGT